MANERRDESGLTLVEVVVALVVLGVLAMATLGILLNSQRTSVDARARVGAANLAAREIDLVREKFLATDDGPVLVANEGVVVNGNPLIGGAAGEPLELDGTSYTIRRSSSWNIMGTGASACEGGSIVDHPALTVEVEVTWPGMGSTKPVRSSTILAPERGQGLPETASFVAIAVKDSKGQPHPGRTVVVSSPSESRSAVSDAAGCAVVAINPPTSGAIYKARFTDSGYVDISGAVNPERSIGHMMPGELSNNVQVAIDRAAEVTIRVFGDGLTDEDADGSTVSLFKSEAAGNTSVTPYVLSGRQVTIGGLWPTNYGAFFGTDVPATIPNMVTLEPGGSAVIEVEFEFARFTVDNAPSGGTMIAVPVGLDCSASNARTVNPSDGTLPPGEWTFFYEHADYGCAPGPEGHELFAGVNSPLEWLDSSLRVTGAPNGFGSIWA
ncbi:MAG: prepilin-type N-terminal cleavage/methylation domain-containing protein, partial [Actinomycetales bacterium]|nr:prepilin-type N-terminal cleavage/methylation domain-containing protein [Actinomycetales bacterium]